MIVFRALGRASPSLDVSIRVNYLVDSITYALFQYVARGLFEQDRLVFTVQLTFQILIASGDIDPVDVDFFLRFPVMSGMNVTGSQVDFLSPPTWTIVKGLLLNTTSMKENTTYHELQLYQMSKL